MHMDLDVLVDLDTGSSDLYLYNYVDGLLDSARTYVRVHIVRPALVIVTLDCSQL